MLLTGKTFSLSDIEEESTKKNMKLAGFYLWLESVVLGLTTVFIVFTFLLNSYSVDGASMAPTFTDGDRVVVLLAYMTPKPGDIIVFTEPNKISAEEKPLIKRVIATEGQIVDINFEKGIVFVDGNALDENAYILEAIREHGVNPMNFPVTIQPDKVFVLGDNRNNSRDSRDLSVGQIDKKYIRGRAIVRYWPTKNIEALKRPEIYE